MKKIFILALTLSAALFTSCKQDLAPASIKLDVTEYTADFAGGDFTIAVLSNRDWTASTDADWIHMSHTSEAALNARTYILVTVMPNNGEVRRATITIAANSGDATATYTVIQDESGRVIRTPERFVAFLESAAKQEVTVDFTLGADLDLAGITLPAVDNFIYSLDGEGHTIKNWTSSSSLFGAISASGSVRNLVIDSSCKFTVTAGTDNFGVIAGSNAGTIENVTNKADIVLSSISGGSKGAVCGVNGGTLSNCVNNGKIAYSGAPLAEGVLCVGGITGSSTGSVNNCTNGGEVSLTFNDAVDQTVYAAGICGAAEGGSLSGCTNSAAVTVKTPGSAEDCLLAGGVAAYSDAAISGCNNEGAVSVLAESADGAADGPLHRACAAGIAAYAGKGVTSCNNYGEIALRGGYSAGFGVVGELKIVSSAVAGIAGLVFNSEVSGCNNYGKVKSSVLNIDNAKSNYNTSTRAAIGGIVGNVQGTVSNCVNSGNVEATYITKAHTAALSSNFVTQCGGISGGSYVSADKTVSSIVNCENNAEVKMTCDSKGSNNCLGGIVGWPGAESGQTGAIENCVSSGSVVADGYGLIRVAGVTAGAANVSGGRVSGKINIAGNIVGSYVGGIVGYEAAVYSVKNVNVDGLVIDYTCPTAMNSVIYGIGGLIGQPQNVNGFATGDGCSVLVTINSNHSRDIGFLGGRNTNQNSTNKMTFGAADKPITVRKGCKIVVSGSTVAEIKDASDVEKVVTTSGSIGNLMGALWYDNWGQYFTKHVVYGE